MQFRELIEKKKSIDQNVLLFGAGGTFLEALESFYDSMRKKYTLQGANAPDFQDRTVPQEVIDVFRPLYDMHRKYEKEMTGKELAAV